jgi:hypothetical protein
LKQESGSFISICNESSTVTTRMLLYCFASLPSYEKVNRKQQDKKVPTTVKHRYAFMFYSTDASNNSRLSTSGHRNTQEGLAANPLPPILELTKIPAQKNCLVCRQQSRKPVSATQKMSFIINVTVQAHLYVDGVFLAASARTLRLYSTLLFMYKL